MRHDALERDARREIRIERDERLVELLQRVSPE